MQASVYTNARQEMNSLDQRRPCQKSTASSSSPPSPPARVRKGRSIEPFIYSDIRLYALLYLEFRQRGSILVCVTARASSPVC